MAASGEIEGSVVPALSPAGVVRKAAPRSRALPVGLAFACLAAVTFHFFPLFRIVPLTPSDEVETNRAAAASAFDAATAAEKIWVDKLIPATGTAAPIAPMLMALRRDPAAAAQQHAHRVGLGRASYYFGRGTGRVVAVEGSRIVLAVDEADGAQIMLRHGPLFGSAVRDGTGLLDVNTFPGLQEFNALAAELNRLVEGRVFPAVRDLGQPGRRLAFAGVAEAPETSVTAGPVLTMVPLHIEPAP